MGSCSGSHLGQSLSSCAWCFLGWIQMSCNPDQDWSLKIAEDEWKNEGCSCDRKLNTTEHIRTDSVWQALVCVIRPLLLECNGGCFELKQLSLIEIIYTISEFISKVFSPFFSYYRETVTFLSMVILISWPCINCKVVTSWQCPMSNI